MSQGNGSTTVLSVSKLLHVVPHIRELSTLKSTLVLSNNEPLSKGADPLMYYVLAREKLAQVSVLIVCLFVFFLAFVLFDLSKFKHTVYKHLIFV